MNLSDSIDNVENFINKKLVIFDNEYISGITYLLIILYAGILAPKLPSNIINILNNQIVKFILFFLMIYLSKKNPNVSIITAIFVLALLYLIEHKYVL